MYHDIECIEAGTCPCGKFVARVIISVRLPEEYVAVCSHECAANLIALVDAKPKGKVQ